MHNRFAEVMFEVVTSQAQFVKKKIEMNKSI